MNALRSTVHFYIGTTFLGVVALLAITTILNAAEMTNPVADFMSRTIPPEAY